MPNRVFAIRYNDHDCLIHLYFDGEKMEVNILDEELSSSMMLKKFSISSTGEILSGEPSVLQINKDAALDFYQEILSQKEEMIYSLAA